MAAHRSIDRQTFLAYLRQSGLVTDEEFAQVARRFADRGSARSLARALIEEGTLTRFQAERLFMGQTAGFLLGQYRILEQIGRGGMGRVYKAEHRTMRRIVALKVLTAELLQTERAIELFLHEVRAVSQLVHPNIVTAFDANEVGGRYYLVLEFVDGPNLDQLVRKQGPLSVGLACDYIRQTANGLQCAHLLGMVHRDIKPANILVQKHGLSGDDSPGLVKVGDFGLARVAHPAAGDGPRATIMTKDNMVMGTPDYLSPEQSRSLRKTDIRSDLYSLGCTFYFLLTGSVPYPGGSQLDKLIRHSTEKPRPISEFRADVPAAVSAIVEKLMARHPEQRYQTPAELAEALRPFAVSGPTPWAPPRAAQGVEADTLATPTDSLRRREGGSSGDIVPAGSDGELAAMAATVSNDQSPTPFAPRKPRRSDEEETQDRLLRALLIAGGLFGGMILLALLVAIFR
jgi:serine/threonine-protein kinase